MEPDIKPIHLAFGAMVHLIKLVAESCYVPGFEDRFNRLNQLLVEAGR